MTKTYSENDIGVILEDIQGTVKGLAEGVSALDEKLERRTEEIRNDLEEFKGEMYSFRSEMYSFRSEMYSFRDEMYSFKGEMYSFRDETRSNFQTIFEYLGALDEEVKENTSGTFRAQTFTQRRERKSAIFGASGGRA